MSDSKKRRVLEKLDEFCGDENIEIVYRDGSRSRLFFEGYDKQANKLMVTDIIIDCEGSFGGPQGTFPIPFEKIGYVKFLEADRKVSFVPFSYVSGLPLSR